ncbi:hypothetical protein J6590_042608 [Homalodisca vitripennis]|nr:hypothetical protein J6590_042608 [Homalodisca vitripennis]
MYMWRSADSAIIDHIALSTTGRLSTTNDLGYARLEHRMTLMTTSRLQIICILESRHISVCKPWWFSAVKKPQSDVTANNHGSGGSAATSRMS